jgi:hypothetical protein
MGVKVMDTMQSFLQLSVRDNWVGRCRGNTFGDDNSFSPLTCTFIENLGNVSLYFYQEQVYKTIRRIPRITNMLYMQV